jgi:hypothetical protein
MLGRRPGWFSMGEFRLFWYAERDGWRCACGEEVTRCPVWSGVLSRVQPDVARVVADLRHAVRVRHVPRLAVPALRRAGAHTQALERLTAVLGDMYRATAGVTGARVLVDSSKDPLYGLALASAPGVQLHVVHLVRDSRAVAWSWQRTRLRPEIAGGAAYMPVHPPTRTALDWDLRNALSHALARRAESFTRVTYEAFVRDPDATVSGIAAAARLTTAPDARTATGDANHTVAGNPLRFSSGAIEVKPDVEWRTAMSPRDRRLVTALTAPLLVRYGYAGPRAGSTRAE